MTETQHLFNLLKKGVSPVHAVAAAEERLVEAGFENLDYGKTGSFCRERSIT